MGGASLLNLKAQVTGTTYGKSSYPRYDDADLGLRGYWYPAMLGRRLRKKPEAITLCGEEIVFFRDEDGRVYACENRCPHRGVPLSLGVREFPGTVTCIYHGWTYDLKTGDLVAALTDGPDSPICFSKGVRVPVFPTEERNGLIWVFVGDGEAPPLEEQIPGDLLDKNSIVIGRITQQRGDWRHAVENGFDEGHAKYLHRRSMWKLFRYLPAWSKMRVTESEDGRWLTRKVTEKGFRSDYPIVGSWPPKKPFWKTVEGEGGKPPPRVSVGLPGIGLIEFQGRFLGPYSSWQIWASAARGEYRYYQFFTQRGTMWSRLRLRIWYWFYSRWVYHIRFNNQDVEMVQLMKTPPERLYRPDVSIVAWRRMCEKALANSSDSGSNNSSKS